MVTRSEIGEFGTAWFQGRGLSVVYETLAPSSRLSRQVPSLRMQSGETVVAGDGLTRTGTLPMLARVSATKLATAHAACARIASSGVSSGAWPLASAASSS